MGQRTRKDRPGARHHITSRGIGQRIIFRDKRDIRFLQSCIAREVRRGTIVVLSFSILTNHFHLLAISLTGELSEAMQRILNRYSKYFNGRYGRDGPLFRSRFRSKVVGDAAYLKAVIRYIDRNAVQARLVAQPWDYPWGSAAAYVHGRRPIWMRSEVVPEVVMSTLGTTEFSGAAYEAFYKKSRPLDIAAVVEARLKSVVDEPNEMDDLVHAAPEKVRDWMIRRARLADGRFLGDPVCSPMTALEEIHAVVAEVDGSGTDWTGRRSLPSDALKTGILRLVAGCRWKEVSALVGKPETSCRRLARRHLELMETDERYGRLASTLVRRLLFRTGVV